MKRLKPLVMVGLAGFAACADNQPLEPRAENDAAAFDRQNAPGQQRLAGLDAEFAQVAREVPGFGGMFYDEAGNLNVFMTSGHLRAAEAQDIRGRLGRSMRARGRDVPAAHRIVMREGQHDFLQLATYNSRMAPVLTVPGVVFTDIDETENRLRIGIEAGVSAADVQHALQMLDVPLEVVSLEVAEPIVPLSGHTLRDRQEPLGGGLQLVFQRGTGWFACTLGFNVIRDAPGRGRGQGRNEPFFMTNSHCTVARGTVTPTEYWHAWSPPLAHLGTVGSIVGVEALDPPFFTDPCFAGWVCRWSDAALVRYTEGTPAKLGAIYRTKSFTTGNVAATLELVEEGAPPFFFIQSESPSPMVGEVLDKVGRTTGWTRGPVTQTCLNTGVSGLPNTAILCQDRVRAMVAGGDSGSPVFQQTGDSKDATLYGILWGGSVQAGQQTYVFSALENIRADLGDFRTH
jgi:hypothetical protein